MLRAAPALPAHAETQALPASAAGVVGDAAPPAAQVSGNV